MKLFNNKTLSVLFVAVLLTFTSACKAPLYLFLREGYVVTPPEKSGTFIIKHDGTKINGLIMKIRIPGKLHLDGVTYSHNDIKAFQWDDNYYVRDRGHYLMRIISGKLNFYESAFSANTETHSYYVQKGETGEIKHVSSVKALAEFVSDCPVVYDKLNHSYGEIKALYKANKYYISETLIKYNETCGK